MLAMAEDIDVDIFKFGSSNRPSFGSERPVGRPPSYFPSSSSDSGSEDDKGRPKKSVEVSMLLCVCCSQPTL